MIPRIASPTEVSDYHSHNNSYSTSNSSQSSRIPTFNATPIRSSPYNIDWQRSNSISSATSLSSQHTRFPSRVKIYYTFEGDMKTCFTAINYQFNLNPSLKIISVPLKQCLLSICRASPEMFFESQEFSVYSMSYEEIATQPPDTVKNIIWEGHGLLSWILENDQNEDKQISGEVNTANQQQYTFEVRVTLKLKWTNRTPQMANRSLVHERYSINHRFASSLDKGKQPALEAPFTDATMNRHSPTLKSRFSDPPAFQGQLPSIVSQRCRMEDKRSLPAFHSRLSWNQKGNNAGMNDNFDDDDDQEYDSEGSNYKPSYEDLDSPAQKHSKRLFAKKRKAKEIEPKGGRYYYEMERDQFGQPILPVEIDSWTVINLGVVDAERPAFHTARYIYPIGYTIKKWYRSMVDAKRDTQYTCRIVDGGEEPRFQVEADDNRGTVFEGRTPTTVWTEVVRKAFAIRNLDYQHSPVGPEFFGLRKNAIAKMIQDLPYAKKCRKYVWQTFRATMSGKAGRNRRRINNLGTLSPEPTDQQNPPNVINLDKPVH